MIIKNLTPDELTLTLQERTGEHNQYKIDLKGHGSTDIDRTFSVLGLPLLIAFKKVEIEGYTIPQKATFEEKLEALANKEDVVENETPAEVPPVEEDLKCDICGAEFASARGLAAHKNRAHKED